MEKQINEHILRLTGKASLTEELKLGNAFKLEIDGAVVEVSDRDNQDGTFDRYYKFAPILVKVLYDNGETAKAKDVRSRSQQFRAVLRREWQECSNEEISFDDYYDREMRLLIGQRIDSRPR